MVRDMIEESGEKLRIKKFDLKQLQWAEQRREREEQANRWERVKLRLEVLRFNSVQF